MSTCMHFLIEPVMFLYMGSCIASILFSAGMYQADVWYDISKNESFVWHCLQHKQESACGDLSERATTDLSNFNMLVNIEYSVLGVFVNLIVGYLSDRVGRSTVFLASVLSAIFISSVLLINSFLLRMPYYTYYISTVIGYLGGGFGAFMGTSYAYISDISTADSRTTRIVIADSMLQLGALFGALTGGQLMAHVTWYSTPLLCVSINVFLLFYVGGVIKNPPSRKRPACDSLQEMLSKTIDIYTKKTPNRTRIFLLAAAYLLHFTAFLSYSGFFMNYLLNPPFNWGADKIGIISTIASICNFLMLLTVPLLKRAGLSEPLMVSISCVLCAGGFAVAAVAQSFSLMALANVLKAGSGVAMAVYRTRLSKLVKPDQFGQLFMSLNSLESIAMLISTVGLYQVYLASRHWFNGFSFLLLVVLELAAMVLTLIEGRLAGGRTEDASDESEEEDLLVPSEHSGNGVGINNSN